MVRWYHQQNGHGFGWTPGVSDGQEGLACCGSRARKESDTTEWLNSTDEDLGITINCGKFWKRWEHLTTWPAFWETCMQVRKQQLELDVEQPTGSKLGKEYIKAVYCHTAYLSYMQSMSCEMPDWMKHKLESRFLGEIWITSDMQMKPPLWQKVKKN